MQISDLTRCRIRGQCNLLMAIPFLLMALYWTMDAWNRGHAVSYVIAAILLASCCHFIGKWMDYMYNECRLVCCHEDAVIIRQKNRYALMVNFKDLKGIRKDRNGYTLHVKELGKCRLPHWDIHDEACRFLDARIAGAAAMKQSCSPAPPAGPV
jgi:hypothetical protein